MTKKSFINKKTSFLNVLIKHFKSLYFSIIKNTHQNFNYHKTANSNNHTRLSHQHKSDIVQIGNNKIPIKSGIVQILPYINNVAFRFYLPIKSGIVQIHINKSFVFLIKFQFYFSIKISAMLKPVCLFLLLSKNFFGLILYSLFLLFS